MDVPMTHDTTSPSAHQSPTQQELSKLSLPLTTSPPSATNPPSPKVWLVFGATGHLGRSIVNAAWSHNDSICAVGFTSADNISAVRKWHSDSSRFLGLLCDVRISSTVSKVVRQCIAHFGSVDIVANCTGYGVIGACEDQDEAEIRNQFETNFMGTLNIIQASLAYFREQRSGRYLIFSSVSGSLGTPGLGAYAATKYAVEGLVESMLYEVDPFNIKVTLVCPGHMRRDDNDLLAERIPLFGHFKVAKTSEPYATKDAPAAHAKRLLTWIGDKQPTSVVKAAELVWQLGHCDYPPLRLLLGTYAVESIRDRLKTIIEEIEDWKHLNFPPLEGHEEKDEDKEEDDADGEGEGDGDIEDDGEGDGEVIDEDDEDDANEDDDDDDDGEDVTKADGERQKEDVEMKEG